MTASDPRVGEIRARLDKVPAKGESAFIGTALPVHATTELWNLRQLAREDVAYLLAELADRDEVIARVLPALTEIHGEVGDEDFNYCSYDGDEYPCETVTALRAAVAAANGGGERG